MGSPLPSPAPSLSSPHASGATPGRFRTPDLDLPRFHLPASSTQRSIERHREEALQVNHSVSDGVMASRGIACMVWSPCILG